MTKIKKFFVATLMVLVSCLTYLGSALLNVSQTFFNLGVANAFNAGNKNKQDQGTEKKLDNGEVLIVKNVPKKLKVGETATIPVKTGVETQGLDADTNTNSAVYVEITGAHGELLTEIVSDTSSTRTEIRDENQVKVSGDDYTLTPSQSGVYKLKYYSKNSSGVYTNSVNFEINVVSDSYTMALQVNDPIVMPQTVQVNSQDESATKPEISISLPILYDKDGNIIDKFVLGDKVTENGASYYYEVNYVDRTNVKLNDVTNISDETNTYTHYKDYEIKKVERIEDGYNYTLKIRVDNDKAHYYNYSTEGDNNKLLQPKTAVATSAWYFRHPYVFTAEEGNNTISYELYLNDPNLSHVVQAQTSFVVIGSQSYDSKNIELGATPSSTIRANSTSYMQKTYLPSVSAINTKDSNNSINAFYYYTIKVVNSDDEQNPYNSSVDVVEMGKDENGFYFIPKAESNSRYEIYYNIVDFYGNTGENDDNYDYSVYITDRQLTNVYYTQSYDPTKSKEQLESDNALEDYSYAVADQLYIDADNYLVIPAVYAWDESGISNSYRRIQSSDATFISTSYENESEKTKKVTSSISINDNNGSVTLGSGFTLPKDLKLIGDGTNDEKALIKYDFGEGKTLYDNDYFTYDKEQNKYTAKKAFSINGKEVEAEKEITDMTIIRDILSSYTAKVYLDPRVFGAGTYTLTISIRDGAYNTNSSTRTFTFELKDSEFETTAPTVTFGATKVGQVEKDQDISISIPDASDLLDKKLAVRYFVVVGEEYLEVKAKDGAIKFNTSDVVKDEQSIYDLAIANGNTFELRAYAFNDYVAENVKTAVAEKDNASLITLLKADYGKEEAQKLKNIGMASYTISVKYVTDTVAPKIDKSTIKDIKGKEFNQNERTEVEGVTFLDDSPNARIYASVVDTNGKTYGYSEVGVTTVEEVSDQGEYKYKYTFPGISFVPTNADKDNFYTVTYSLVDAGNNTVSYSFVLVHAVDKTAPTITGVTGTEQKLELGEAFYLTQLKAEDNYTDADKIKFDVSVKLTNAQGETKDVSSSYNPITKALEPREVGTYEILIRAVDEGGNETPEELSRKIRVVVEDTLSPLIHLSGTGAFKTTINENDIPKDADNDNAPKYEEVNIYIPAVSVEDQKPENAIDILDMFGVTATIEVTAPTKDNKNVSTYVYDLDGNIQGEKAENTINFKKTADGYTFNPVARGKYTVVYKAVDKSGKEATEKKEIDVGDTVGPTINFSKALEDKLNAGFTLGENATLEINPNARISGEDGYNLSDIWVYDNSGFNYETDEDEGVNYVPVTITISKPISGTLAPREKEEGSENTKNIYDFTTAGTYTISVTVSDKLGKPSTKTMTFVVKAKTSKSIDTTTILGTILIVVSVLILIGVVIYFVRGAKLLPKKKGANAKKSKKEVEKEDKE